MKAYKGFNKDMTCRGYQYKEGESYETDRAELCKSGFHACENPLDCWEYYNLLDGEFHEVELDEVSEEREDDTKICGKKIKIGAKLSICDMVNASVEFVMNNVKGAKNPGKRKDRAQIGSSGDWAQIGSSGYRAKIGSSGYRAKIGSSGDKAQIDMTGMNSVAAAVGDKGRIRGKIGCWIVLAEWGKVNEEYTPICVKAVQIDGEKYKQDTWYKMENGKIVEVE